MTLWVFPISERELYGGAVDGGESTSFSSERQLYEDDGVSVEYITSSATKGSSIIPLGCTWERRVGGVPAPHNNAGGKKSTFSAAEGGAHTPTPTPTPSKKKAGLLSSFFGLGDDEDEEEGEGKQQQKNQDRASLRNARINPPTVALHSESQDILSCTVGAALGEGFERLVCGWGWDRNASLPPSSLPDSLTLTHPPHTPSPSLFFFHTHSSPTATSWTWRFIATLPPESVSIDGVPAIRDHHAAPDAWGDGARWAPPPPSSDLHVSVNPDGSSSVSAKSKVRVCFVFCKKEYFMSRALFFSVRPQYLHSTIFYLAQSYSGSWAYQGATLSTWVHSFSSTPRTSPTTVTLTWPIGVDAHTNHHLTAGAPHMISRAQVSVSFVFLLLLLLVWAHQS